MKAALDKLSGYIIIMLITLFMAC